MEASREDKYESPGEPINDSKNHASAFCGATDRDNHHPANLEICPAANSTEQLDSKIPSVDYWLATFVSLIAGILGFFVYYQMTLSFVILRHIWQVEVFTYLLGGVQCVSGAVGTFMMLPLNSLKTRYIYISCILYIVSAIAFPLIVWGHPGMDNFSRARLLLVLVSIVAGLGDALQSFSGLSLAANFPKSRIAIYSGGAGFGGAIPWTIFVILHLYVSSETAEGRITTLFCFFSVAAAICVLQMILITFLRRRHWFQQFLGVAAKNHEEQFSPGENRWKQIFLIRSAKEDSIQHCGAELRTRCSFDTSSEAVVAAKMQQLEQKPSSVKLLAPRQFICVVKDCALQATNAFLLIVGTMLLFPTIAPYGFHLTDTWTAVLMGVGHISHTGTRFLPALLPCTQINPKWLLPVIIARFVIFTPICIVVHRLEHIKSLQNPWILCLLLFVYAGLHGWMATLTDIYTVHAVTHPQERAMASKVLVIVQWLACAVGQFGSYFLTL